MINLSVDEGYAFDYLSILSVKKDRYPSTDKVQTYTECYENIKNQCTNFEEIINSTEYEELLKSNEYTFDLIDELRKEKNVNAKEIDDSNMHRYYKKVNLQKRFFPNSSVTETKMV
jgi:hypothetical protein